MFEIVWPWAWLLLPLPIIVRKLSTPAQQKILRQVLKVPFLSNWQTMSINRNKQENSNGLIR